MATLREGRHILISEQENDAIEALRADHGERCSITRRDPGGQGPLLVEFADKRFKVAADGTVSDG